MNKRKVTFWVLGFAGLATLAGFLLAFLVAAPARMTATAASGEPLVDFSQKIFYFHVPVAIASFVVFFFTAYYAVRFLMTRKRIFDTKSRIATEVTLVFVLLTMLTGDLWTRVSWGVWWVWEPRLTTYFILMLLVIAYFVLRASVEDEEKRATYAAVFGIIAFIDAPISFAITRLVPSGAEVHPVVIGVPGGLDTGQLVTFLITMFGMMAFGYVIYQLRYREERVKEQLEALKAALEE